MTYQGSYNCDTLSFSHLDHVDHVDVSLLHKLFFELLTNPNI